MFNINQFRESIVQSTLKDLMMYSQEAEELIVFTCATESMGGTFLRQVNGPALGIYQMEPETYFDIWEHYLKLNSHLCMRMVSNFNVVNMPSPDRMIYDLRYATAMARLFYARIMQPLPPSNDVDAIWDYYKLYYNTARGKAVKQESLMRYHHFLAG